MTPALAIDPAPSLAAIIQRVIARDDSNEKQLQSMEYSASSRTEQLGADGKATKHQEVKMIVRPGAKDEITILTVTGDDLPSDPDQAAQKAKGDETKRKNIRIALKDMAKRFTITLAGTDTVEGQPTYVLAFAPKPNQGYRDQTEKVLNQLQGRLWISTSDYSVLKTDASLAAPVDVVWFVAQISKLDFHYELHNTTGGMGPATVQTSVVVDAPFIQIRQRSTIEMTDFRPRTATVAGK
jgi:hypothetical protein